LAARASRQVCCVHKADGIGLTPAQLHTCVGLATQKAAELRSALQAALAAHETARVQVWGLPLP
jgi:hypothetical protein